MLFHIRCYRYSDGRKPTTVNDGSGNDTRSGADVCLLQGSRSSLVSLPAVEQQDIRTHPQTGDLLLCETSILQNKSQAPSRYGDSGSASSGTNSQDISSERQLLDWLDQFGRPDRSLKRREHEYCATEVLWRVHISGCLAPQPPFGTLPESLHPLQVGYIVCWALTQIVGLFSRDVLVSNSRRGEEAL